MHASLLAIGVCSAASRHNHAVSCTHLQEFDHCKQVLKGQTNTGHAPHFGTSAALDALQPLRAALAGRGLAFDGVSGYSLDAASLQRAGSAALQGGVQAIEVSRLPASSVSCDVVGTQWAIAHATSSAAAD